MRFRLKRGRNAHLNGEIAKALLAKADALFITLLAKKRNPSVKVAHFRVAL